MCSTLIERNLLGSGGPTVFFWKVPLKVAAIMKNAKNVDYALAFATTVDDEVPGILHNPEGCARSVSA